MKHPHAELIKAWLEDTSQEIRRLDVGIAADYWRDSDIMKVIADSSRFHEYELKTSDPYAELRKAQAEGKRIVWQDSSGKWVDNASKEGWKFVDPVDRYKIVDHDIVDNCHIAARFGIVGLKLTKCGITGKITVEVVE